MVVLLKIPPVNIHIKCSLYGPGTISVIPPACFNPSLGLFFSLERNVLQRRIRRAMMEVKPVLALPEGFHLVGLEKRDNVVTVTPVPTRISACCPLCGRVARRVHSCYTSHVTDLPCAGQSICLLIQIIGLATGGRLGVHVTDRLVIQSSRQTIPRRIMALPTEPVGSVPQIGIDDFSDHSGKQIRHDHRGRTNASGARHTGRSDHRNRGCLDGGAPGN